GGWVGSHWSFSCWCSCQTRSISSSLRRISMPRAAERSTTQARKSTRGRRKKTAPPPLRERIARRMRRLWYAAFVFVVAVGVLDVLFLLGVTSPQQIRDAVLSPLRRTGSQFITDSSAPLASFYAPSVLYWEDSIQRWADEYGV